MLKDSASHRADCPLIPDPLTYSIHSMGQAEAGLDPVVADKEVENIAL